MGLHGSRVGVRVGVSLTSKIRPEANVVAFQQFIHSFFHEGHVARIVHTVETNKEIERGAEMGGGGGGLEEKDYGGIPKVVGIRG